MKLSITLPEAQEGRKKGRFGKKWDDIKTMANGQHVVALTRPVRIENKEYWLAKLRSADQLSDRQEISFDLIWARAFTIGHIRSSKLKAVVVQSDKETVLLDGFEKKSARKFSLAGPGCNPEDVEDAGRQLAKIVSEKQHSLIQQQVRQYLKDL